MKDLPLSFFRTNLAEGRRQGQFDANARQWRHPGGHLHFHRQPQLKACARRNWWRRRTGWNLQLCRCAHFDHCLALRHHTRRRGEQSFQELSQHVNWQLPPTAFFIFENGWRCFLGLTEHCDTHAGTRRRCIVFVVNACH